MKNKLWRCGMAVLAVVLVAGIFACDKGNPGDSEKVSEADWEAAFAEANFENVTVTGTQEITYDMVLEFET